MNDERQKGALTWRLPARLVMAILALAIVVIAVQDNKLWFAAKPYYAQSYCEPECPETIVERPRLAAERTGADEWSWTREFTPRVLLAILIVGLLGFAIGRLTATAPPTPAAVAAAIAGATTARVAEANTHSVGAAATPMLNQLGASATTAVTKLLQPLGSAAYIALLAAALLTILLFVLPVAPA